MKILLMALALSLSSAYASEPIRDLSKQPLTANEKMALRVSKRFAVWVGEKTKDVCVNASFEPGTEPVSVQFYREDEEGAGCVDPPLLFRSRDQEWKIYCYKTD
ncbi:MAG: hypothetical protein H0V66_04875 [Bdellovibrionales bacterium]|nr:hypothetical protein [Bdellovibrionales bacterium]